MNTIIGEINAATLTADTSAASASGDLSLSASISGRSETASLSGAVSLPSGIVTMVTDETLTLAGRAADAKTVGDRLTAISGRVETLETEVGNASLLLSLILG